MTRALFGILGVALVCAVVVAKANPVGSLALEQVDPTAGAAISFVVDASGLPTNGGATISPWVELSCGAVYEDLQPAISAVTPGTTNPTRAYFTLSSPAWVAARMSAQSCEAYLFYDGWNGPRRRKTNTLASQFFSVAAAP